jgi:SAM-dependent methyltransferase
MPMVDFFICKECFFSSPTKEYQDQELASLYIGYRGTAYNEERIQLEPEYKKISAFIGNDIYEINSRQENINLLLKTTGLVHKVKSLIDWGGGDGRFVPELLSSKKVYVYDISGEKVFNKSFVSISDRKLLPQVDYIQVCHVLEHVGDPRGLLIDVLNNLKSGGFLYIEVPVDRDVDEIKDMIANYDLAKFVIHEHINLFSDISIKKLGENVGLKVLSVNTTSIKLSRGYAKIISALFQKN